MHWFSKLLIIGKNYLQMYELITEKTIREIFRGLPRWLQNVIRIEVREHTGWSLPTFEHKIEGKTELKISEYMIMKKVFAKHDISIDIENVAYAAAV